jgi:hypothetical protein
MIHGFCLLFLKSGGGMMVMCDIYLLAEANKRPNDNGKWDQSTRVMELVMIMGSGIRGSTRVMELGIMMESTMGRFVVDSSVLYVFRVCNLHLAWWHFG